jgi:hypothetical protein
LEFMPSMAAFLGVAQLLSARYGAVGRSGIDNADCGYGDCGDQPAAPRLGTRD